MQVCFDLQAKGRRMTHWRFTRTRRQLIGHPFTLSAGRQASGERQGRCPERQLRQDMCAG